MSIDIKEKVEEIVKKISGDENLQKQFKDNPVKAVESLIGVDFPDDIIEQVVKGVKGKLTVDNISDAVDALKKLF